MMHTRRFTRYPTDIPISFEINGMMGEHQLYLKDAGQGGLCANALACIELGTHLNMNVPFSGKPHNSSANVVWCQPLDNGQCRLGIAFAKHITQSVVEKNVLIH